MADTKLDARDREVFQAAEQSAITARADPLNWQTPFSAGLAAGADVIAAYREEIEKPLRAANAKTCQEAEDKIGELEAAVEDLKSAEAEADRRFLSGEQVGVSTGICGDITYGYGTLSDNGYWEYPVNPALVDLKRKAEANAQAAHALEAMRDRRLRVSPPGLHDQWSARTENDSVNVGFGADPIEAVAAYERAKGGE